MLDDHISGREDLSRQIWGLLNFTLWYDRYARVPEGAAAGAADARHDRRPLRVHLRRRRGLDVGAGDQSLARRIGDRAIDYPNERSLHQYPTPKLGGLAVLVAVLIGGSIFLPWDHETRSILAGAIVITPWSG